MEHSCEEIPLSEAAYMLGWKWAKTFDALLEGRLEGQRGVNGRWRVRRESVERLKRQLTSAAPTAA